MENESSSKSLPNPGTFCGLAENIQYLGILDQSLATLELPSMATPLLADPALHENPVRVHPALLAYASNATRHSRVGWSKLNAAAPLPQPPQHGRGSSNATGVHATPLICYISYCVGHTASQCTLQIREIWKIVGNYENLPPEHNASVPSNSYEDERLRSAVLRLENALKPRTVTIRPLRNRFSHNQWSILSRKTNLGSLSTGGEFSEPEWKMPEAPLLRL